MWSINEKRLEGSKDKEAERNGEVRGEEGEKAIEEEERGG